MKLPILSYLEHLRSSYSISSVDIIDQLKKLIDEEYFFDSIYFVHSDRLFR